MSESTGGFCVDCGHHVDSFEGLAGCPACGSKSIPCADRENLTVAINWHELRILTIWAENWQRQHNLGRTVYAIARRVEDQFPGHDRAPLTLAAELGELAKAFDGNVSVSDAALRKDVAEQTGEELGLSAPPPPKEPWQ